MTIHQTRRRWNLDKVKAANSRVPNCQICGGKDIAGHHKTQFVTLVNPAKCNELINNAQDYKGGFMKAYLICANETAHKANPNAVVAEFRSNALPDGWELVAKNS